MSTHVSQAIVLSMIKAKCESSDLWMISKEYNFIRVFIQAWLLRNVKLVR